METFLRPRARLLDRLVQRVAAWRGGRLAASGGGFSLPTLFLCVCSRSTQFRSPRGKLSLRLCMTGGVRGVRFLPFTPGASRVSCLQGGAGARAAPACAVPLQRFDHVRPRFVRDRGSLGSCVSSWVAGSVLTSFRFTLLFHHFHYHFYPLWVLKLRLLDPTSLRYCVQV